MSTITLQNFRVGSDLTVKIRLKDGGVAIDWSTLSGIRAILYSDAQSSIAGRCDVTVDGEDPTLLVCRYAATKMQYLGVNRIVVSAKYMGETKTYDKPAFTFVRWTADQEGEQITIEDPEVTVEISVEDISSSILQEAVDAAFSAADRANDAAEAAEHMVDIHTGPEGKSAYEVAVEEGYTGTEEEWLASLKGPVGETPNISIGTVTTVEPGTPAEATMTGTPEAPVLNLSIPKGLVGATPNFTIGTVTTGEPGTPVVVTLTGTAEAPVLNITIPQGMQGNTGSSVAYPFELVNNLTTDDATKALSAAQGKVLDGKISQLRHEVTADVSQLEAKVLGKPTETSPSYSAGTRYFHYETIAGIKYKVTVNSTAAASVIVYDEDKNVLQNLGAVPAGKSVEFIAEYSGYYIGGYFNAGSSSYTVECIGLIDKINNDIETISPVEAVLESGYYGFSADSGGVITEVSHATIKRWKCPVKKGDVIYLRNEGGGSNRAWLVSDESGNVLAKADAYLDFIEDPIYLEITENDAAYVYVNFARNHGDYGTAAKTALQFGYFRDNISVNFYKWENDRCRFDLKTWRYTAGSNCFSTGQYPTAVYIKVNRPILRPILFSAVGKAVADNSSINVSYIPDDTSSYSTVYNNILPRFRFSNREYQPLEFLIPPFLFDSGTIKIDFTASAVFRYAEICEYTPDRRSGDVLMVSHLGYMLGYNTMAAFKMAASVGFKACVANLRATADDVMVCAHDDNFTASSDGQTYYISQKTYAEIESLGYQENGNTNAKTYYESAHLVTTEEFLRHCALTGMHPVFSAKTDVDYTELSSLLKKYGFDGKDGLTYKAGSLSLFETAHAGLGDNVRYMYDILRTDFANDLQAWIELDLGNATKAIELTYDTTRAEVEACLAEGMRVSLFDDHFRFMNYYKDWVDWGIREFTTDNMISGGLNWYN